MDSIYIRFDLLLSVLFALILGGGILNVAIAVSIAYITQHYRIVRNNTKSVKNEYLSKQQKRWEQPQTELCLAIYF